jgi:hypothetical protein
LFIRSEETGHVLVELNAKFAGALQQALQVEKASYAKAELKARAITETAEILKASAHLSSSQKVILCLFDEVFADTICSIYLAGCSLDKPAQILLRRAFEVGVASVYLWDLPHRLWGWKNHDNDLNFNEMLEYFDADAYRTFLKAENADYKGDDLPDFASARRLYRNLSNVVHGKYSDFETALPNRFQHSVADWKTHLERVLEVEDILTSLWKARFAEVARDLPTHLPQLKTESF